MVSHVLAFGFISSSQLHQSPSKVGYSSLKLLPPSWSSFKLLTIFSTIFAMLVALCTPRRYNHNWLCSLLSIPTSCYLTTSCSYGHRPKSMQSGHSPPHRKGIPLLQPYVPLPQLYSTWPDSQEATPFKSITTPFKICISFFWLPAMLVRVVLPFYILKFLSHPRLKLKTLRWDPNLVTALTNPLLVKFV